MSKDGTKTCYKYVDEKQIILLKSVYSNDIVLLTSYEMCKLSL